MLPHPCPTGAGYFEVCGAALRTLTPDSALHGKAAVAGAAIPAPLLLPAMAAGASVVLECSVGPGTGALEVASLAHGASSRLVHVTASAAWIASQHATPVPGRSKKATTLLMPALGAAPAGPSAAMAALQMGMGRSGIWMDPAAFDCFLQLGQAFKAVDDAEVYVPTGLGALRIASSASQEVPAPVSSAWAATVPVPSPSEGVLANDFHLAGSSDATRLCSISSLTAKSMGKVHAAKAAAAAATRTDCLYEVSWQVTSAASLAAATDLPGTELWRMHAHEKRQPEAAAASAIAAVQRLLKNGSPTQAAVQLQTAGAALLPTASTPGVCSSRTAAAAALSGLVKTLGQEVPQLIWSTSDADASAPASLALGSASLVQLPAGAEAGDAFGSAARDGAMLAPLLLKSAAVEQTGPYHLFPQPRGSLNSLTPLPVDAGKRLAANEVLVAVKAVGVNFR